MRNVGIVYDEIYGKHDTGFHPEKPERLFTTLHFLEEEEIYGDSRRSHFIPISPRAATRNELLWKHTPSMINRVIETVEQSKKRGRLLYFDGDTVASPASYEAALRAAGGNFSLIDAIMEGNVSSGFVLCRPPGHHSNARLPRGFCIFNNIALATEYLTREKGVKKVAIVDYDAHAGNGTEELLYNGLEKGEVLFISTHQHPSTLYPGTCFIEDIGEGKQKGKIVNVTYSPESGHSSVKKIFENFILPMLDEFSPEFILVSAGFDAHHEDPLTNLGFLTQTYSYMTEKLVESAEKHAQGRLLCTLEGGYNLERLAQSITNVIKVLAGENPVFEEDFEESRRAIKFTDDTLLPELFSTFKPYWKFIK